MAKKRSQAFFSDRFIRLPGSARRYFDRVSGQIISRRQRDKLASEEKRASSGRVSGVSGANVSSAVRSVSDGDIRRVLRSSLSEDEKVSVIRSLVSSGSVDRRFIRLPGSSRRYFDVTQGKVVSRRQRDKIVEAEGKRSRLSAERRVRSIQGLAAYVQGRDAWREYYNEHVPRHARMGVREFERWSAWREYKRMIRSGVSKDLAGQVLIEKMMARAGDEWVALPAAEERALARVARDQGAAGVAGVDLAAPESDEKKRSNPRRVEAGGDDVRDDDEDLDEDDLFDFDE